MITQTINIPLTQRELKKLTVLTSSFIEDITRILKHLNQHGGTIDPDFIKTSIEMAGLLRKLNAYHVGAIDLEVAELDAMFDMPSVNPSVGASDEKPSAAESGSDE